MDNNFQSKLSHKFACRDMGSGRRNAAYCWWWLSRSSMARSACQSWIGVFVIGNDRSLYHCAVGVENKHF